MKALSMWQPWAQAVVWLILADVEALVSPVPYAGERGFFDVPDSILAGADFEAPRP